MNAQPVPYGELDPLPAAQANAVVAEYVVGLIAQGVTEAANEVMVRLADGTVTTVSFSIKIFGPGEMPETTEDATPPQE